MTAGELILAAFRKLAITTSESRLTDTEKENAIFELNNMMRQLETKAVVLGYSPVSDFSDEITTPDWSWRFMYLRLALMISPEYGKTPSQLLAADAAESFKDVIKALRSVPQVALPPDLPIGSGYDMQRTYSCSSKFVGNPREDDLLAGDGGALQDEGSETLRQQDQNL